MAVNNMISTSGPYAGNDISTAFSVTFNIKQSSQVAVFQTNALGVTTQLVETTNYTVTGIPDAPLVNLNVALPTGETLLLTSAYVATQLTELESQGGFFPDTIENVFDKLTYLILQLQRKALQSEDGTSFYDASSKTIDNLTDATEAQSAVTLAQLTVVSDAVAGKLDSVVAGDNILIDNTDPNNPIITGAGAGASGATVVLPVGTNLLSITTEGSYFVEDGVAGPAGVTDYFFTVVNSGSADEVIWTAKVAVGDGALSGKIYTYTRSFPGVLSGWDDVGYSLLSSFSSDNADEILATGYATSATEARFFLPINGFINPTSITLTDTFNVTGVTGGIVGGGGGVTPTLATTSSKRVCVLIVTGLSGLTSGAPYNLTTVLSTSEILVNY